MGVSFDIYEPELVPAVDVEGSDQESRHLGSGDRLMRAVARRVSGASLGDPQIGEALDVRAPPQAIVHIGEAAGTHCIRLGLVEYANQPDRHHPALDRAAGTDLIRRALGAREDAVVVQVVDALLVNAAIRAVGEFSGCDPGHQQGRHDRQYGGRRRPPSHNSYRSPR